MNISFILVEFYNKSASTTFCFSNNFFTFYEQALDRNLTNLTLNGLLIEQLISSKDYVDIIVIASAARQRAKRALQTFFQRFFFLLASVTRTSNALILSDQQFPVNMISREQAR